ncbi:MAG: chromate transporter, partial [Chitinophagales bacterium]
MNEIQKPTFKEALRFWIKLGWISFGGPAGQVAIMHEFLVDQKKWISEKKFLHALNYCMLLPGPEAQQLATYTGWLLHGRKGGLAAGLFFILPSIFILLALSIIYVTFGSLPAVNAIFEGLKPAVVAIVIVAMIKIGKKSLISLMHIAVAIFSFIAIYFLHIAFPIIIVATILLGFLIYKFAPHFLSKSGNNKSEKADDESGYYLTTERVIPHAAFKVKNLIIQLSWFVVLWVAPFILFFVFSGDFVFWRQLNLFFTQAAFVTFGGAYAVLPYVAQQAVEH